jgi:hypothetical protein
MGMDVCGITPRSEVGQYFRANVWWWRPLAQYVEDMHPEFYKKNEYWHLNDGGGLDAADSRALGEAIQKEIDDGRALVWVSQRDTELSELPSEECDLCHGTGHRTDGVIPPDQPCNKCEGRGTVRPWATHYHCDIESLQGFANFLKECGGFEIW